MTNKIEATVVDSVVAAKGKSIRATALKPGSAYVMMLTTKPTKTHNAVSFIGFGKARDALVAIPQLKTLTDADKFWFIGTDGNTIECYGAPGAVLFKAGENEVRATFFEKLANTTALTPVEEPAAEVAQDVVAEQEQAADVNEEPVVDQAQVPEGWQSVETSVEEPAAEVALEQAPDVQTEVAQDVVAEQIENTAAEPEQAPVEEPKKETKAERRARQAAEKAAAAQVKTEELVEA